MVTPQRIEMIGVIVQDWDGVRLSVPTKKDTYFMFLLRAPRYLSKLFSDEIYKGPFEFKDGVEIWFDIEGKVAWELSQVRRGRSGLRLKVCGIATECDRPVCEERGHNHPTDYEVESFTVLGWT